MRTVEYDGRSRAGKRLNMGNYFGSFRIAVPNELVRMGLNVLATRLNARGFADYGGLVNRSNQLIGLYEMCRRSPSVFSSR
jgi:hypothetical protein